MAIIADVITTPKYFRRIKVASSYEDNWKSVSALKMHRVSIQNLPSDSNRNQIWIQRDNWPFPYVFLYKLSHRSPERFSYTCSLRCQNSHTRTPSAVGSRTRLHITHGSQILSFPLYLRHSTHQEHIRPLYTANPFSRQFLVFFLEWLTSYGPVRRVARQF